MHELTHDPFAVVPEVADRAVPSKKPKVCFVGLDNLPVLSKEHAHHGNGGEQVQHMLLARALAARGYDVCMVVADYGQPDGQRFDGIKTHRAAALTGGIPIVRLVPRHIKLWAAMKRADADVYYVSTASMQVGLVAWFARSHGRRVIFRIASDQDCELHHSIVSSWHDRKLFAYGIRRVDAVLAQSDQQVAAMQRNFGVKSRIAGMLVEPAGCEIEFSARDIDVLWVNNFAPFKRPALAIDLARRLPHLRFHIIGGAKPGHEALYEGVRSSAKELANVTFHGRVPYHEVNQYYDRAKVFFNTSELEGFPNSFLQAWQRGVPLVSFFDPDGIVRRLGLGSAVLGLDEMAVAVNDIATDESKWLAMGARCRAFMREHYGDDAVLAAYELAIAR